ncbi:LuxR C-terminal-related transcriptional regulator [Leifsonia aquatica]|uniref:Signal transduction histidine kinase/DNA-binding NarL/FixJ family response regulator n=4 Tax=Leifsonia aquatica TaxID=144185 RepID=A0A7W4UTL0_LEIAQ|nr:ATP-binding protein [Leifsonia aquatica]MBB2965940.1 signal transduction histidine kinase/DNA-binding NarL/FixJ family response regulator [Leifsonia aquatica]
MEAADPDPNTRTTRDSVAPAPRLSAPFDTLAALAEDLAGHFALGPLLERILRHTLELLGCDSGSICTVDEASGTYRKDADLGVGCRSGATFPLDEGVTGEVVRARGTVVFDEYAQVRGGHIDGADRDLLHATIGVPIRWNGAIIGALVVFSRDPGRRFSGPEAQLIESFAAHAGIAITNARLHAVAAERAQEAAVATERERVVRDVHDTVGRGLADILLRLDEAERRTAAGEDPRAALTQARRAARSALSETQRTVLGLGPEQLDGRSLGEAIGLELAWAESAAGLSTRLVVVGEPGPLAPETVRQLFRIVQESLTNVVEHASARQVRVGIVYGEREVTALIEDDGRGFDVGGLAKAPSRPLRGLGLQGLAARAEHLGGSIHIESTPQWGTRVRAELPVAAAAREHEHARWRVLVAHASPLIRSGLVRSLALAEPDIQVVAEVADAQSAVEAYDLLRPNVVLADLDLPHVDGVQLTSYLRAADDEARVVLLIGSVADDRLLGGTRVGAAGFVEATADPAAIARTVVAAARGDLLLSPEFLSRFAVSLTGGDEPLTAREREVRALVEQGMPDKQIAATLHISVKTVEKHVGALLRKTGAANRTVLAARR